MSANLHPYVVTLGTAGGPRWWEAAEASERSGIATAVVVGDAFYVVDFGQGAGRRLSQSGLKLKDMRALFITHLHSDHVYDLAGLGIFGLYAFQDRTENPVRIIGPGNRGELPPVSPRAVVAPAPLAPECPTPGTREMFEKLMAAHATDLNDRILDSLKPSPLDVFRAEDITIPASSGYHPNASPTPAMEPFEVYKDELVTVTAILVEHPPVAPAFAFRFDTAEGSVTISGDTCFTQNLVTLAQGTDLLLHEAIDFDWVESLYADKADEASRAARDHHYKSHTSVRDAAKAAEAAGARQLALHHLVPGSAADRIWEEAAEHFEGRFILPRDLDVIPFARAN
ncbi:MBL fold metallo-hydrolase [Arthrobacter cavernae]|uniref:MBL fold metallo-hydrolase n=1 Tax=Arthrobacter cavernae TaxID=2817681 RepID=A0A939KMD7_9MICC|nr:MBL fold metallo-hydrolase [Arthrobacter cavernae]MBO1268168.1 MBL fold metallo-hydrolase [Arthrobacter cavernae]